MPPKPPPPKPPAEYGSLGLLPGADEVEVIFNPILLSRSPPSGEAKTWRTAELPPLPGWGSRGSTPIKKTRARQYPDESEQRNRPPSRTSSTSAFVVWDLPSPSVSVSVADESSGKDAISTGNSPGPQSPVCHVEGPSPHGQFYYRGEVIRLYRLYPSRARERQEKRSAHKMRKAMVSIQTKARGLLAKAKYGAVRHALVQIQANARRLAARRNLANACSAALFIQLRFRALCCKVAHRRGRPLPTASAPGTLQGTRRQNQPGSRSASRSPRRSQQQGPISLGTLSAYMYTWEWESDSAGKSGAPARSLVSPGSSAASLCDSNRDAACGRPSTPRDPSARLCAPRWIRPQRGMGLPRPIVFETAFQPHRKSAALSAAARRAAYSLGAHSGAWCWESDGTAWSVDTRLDRNASALQSTAAAHSQGRPSTGTPIHRDAHSQGRPFTVSTAAAGLSAQRMREVPSTPVSGSSSRLRTLLEHNHRPPMVIPDSAALKDGTSERRPLMPPLPRSRTQRPVVEPPPVHVASRWPKKPPVLERHRTKLALQAATASVARSSSMPVLFLREGDCKVELASAISQSRPKLLRPRDSGRLDP